MESTIWPLTFIKMSSSALKKLCHVSVVFFNTSIFLYLISLFFLFSLSFFQKDLPLPRKNSRWVLPSFIPLFFPPSVFPLLSGERLGPSMKKNNHTEWSCICTFINKVSPPEPISRLAGFLGWAWFALCVWKLWGCFSGACGVECVLLEWRRRRSAGESVGVRLRPAGSSGCCPWSWKPFLPFPVTRSLALYLPLSSSHCSVINLFLLCFLFPPLTLSDALYLSLFSKSPLLLLFLSPSYTLRVCLAVRS